jgi:hypothetical protein
MSAVGWAFLVARTRTRGYRLMLAPAERCPIRLDLIERYARPHVNGGGPTIQILRDGPATLSLVCDTHRLTQADLGTASPGTQPADLVLDEHGRPIDVVYGFVCEAAVQEAAESDLATARTQALDAYSRALTGDEAQPSKPYRLESSMWAEPHGHASALRVEQPFPPAPARSAVTTRVRSTRSTRIWAIVAGAVTVFIGAIGGCVALRPPTVSVPGELAGTWTGTLEPTAGGSETARRMTVTIDCKGGCSVSRGHDIGRVHDNTYNCDYKLSAESFARGVLTANATVTADRSPCLPPGIVHISRTFPPEAITIDWSSKGQGERRLTATRTPSQ